MGRPKAPVFTIQRYVAITAIGCLSIYVLTNVQRMREDRATVDCLSLMRNLHTTLELYRADWNGFSPAVDPKAPLAMEVILGKYAGHKPISHETNAYFDSSQLRAAPRYGGTGEMIPFGIEDTSLEVNPCYDHVRYVTTMHADRNGWPTTSTDYEPPNGGSLNVLLRNGTAKSVPGNKETENWVVQGGKFMPYTQVRRSSGFTNVYLLDFEPKPPQFEY